MRSNNSSPVKRFQEGVIQQLPSHLMPLIPEIKIDKVTKIQQTTALGKCFRGLIKQRIFGNIMNQRRKSNISINLSNEMQKQSKIIPIQKQSQRYSLIQKPQKQQIYKSRDKRNYSVIKTNSTTKETIIRNSNNLLDINKNKIKDNQYYTQEQRSFISAIEQHDNNIQKQLFIKQKNNNIILPKISKPLQKVKKATSYQQNIINEIWNIVTIQNTQYNMAKNKSKSINNELKSTSGTLQSSTQTIQSILTFANSLVEKKYIHKQSYLKYLNLVNPKLFAKFLYFFDIRVFDSMDKQTYFQMISGISKQNQRIWGTMIFQFFDYDHNGIIDSSDLFKCFEQLQNQQKKYDNNQIDSGQQNLQMTLIKNFQKKQWKYIKQQIQKCRQVLIEQVNKLNELIQQNRKQSSQQKHTFEKTQSNMLNYLQQSLLKDIQIKYTDIIDLIQADPSSSQNNQKKSVLCLTDQIQVKFSSCYRQSFMATQHNQQTRINREKIETLKEKLKDIRNNRIVKHGGITYKNFIDKQCYANIMKLILQINGLKEIKSPQQF